MEPKQLLISLVLLFFFAMKKVAVDCSCSDDQLYVIKSTGSGGKLVFDASKAPQVRLQHFTGYSSQLWQFKRGSRVGLYYITNNDTGNALDFVDNTNGNLKLVTKKDSLRQQWDLGLSGKIINASNGKNIDVTNGDFNNDTLLHIYQDNDTASQKFDLKLMGIKPNVDLCKYLLR